MTAQLPFDDSSSLCSAHLLYGSAVRLPTILAHPHQTTYASIYIYPFLSSIPFINHLFLKSDIFKCFHTSVYTVPSQHPECSFYRKHQALSFPSSPFAFFSTLTTPQHQPLHNPCLHALTLRDKLTFSNNKIKKNIVK